MNTPVSFYQKSRARATDPAFEMALTIPPSVGQQLQEMQMVREKVYQMEQTHMALKQK